ncbi:hypothetical protein MTR67_029663 [Solanum verrucosum]|uniref:Uncharacterized protein n=1 Tax=Solanum verrucosum TaxID=315347 RepID=A0AAF0U0X1_SOLVR|nr:hypothetical protein MTR67_029663 [Solanum verrucosum]
MEVLRGRVHFFPFSTHSTYFSIRARASFKVQQGNDPFFQAAIERASLRFRESHSPDPLLIDPYVGCLLPCNSVEDMDQELHPYCLATKFIDDKLLETMQSTDGLKQVVLLTDGLDTRPYRLNWPTSTLVFDICPEKVFRGALQKLQGNREKHKFHLIEWEKVTQPKYQGGLGIKNLAAHNKSMMMKWLWRYNLEDAGLWKEVIIAKHGRLNQWCSNITTLPYGVGLWKSIRMLWDTFDQNAYFELGNGLLLKFWTDKWLGNTTLQEDFPDLFRIAQDPNSVIAANREGINWDLRFRRNMHDWEVNDLVDLFARLQHCHINLQAADKLKWGHQKGVYTVKEGYQQLCSRNLVIANWPWKLIWRTKLPPKVIKLKYGEMDSWVTKEATNSYGVTVWRSIRNWWPFLRNHTTIIHNGIKTRFWKDRWLAYPYGTTVDDIDAGAKIPRGCMSFHVPSESFDVENILCSKGFSGTRPSIWAFQGLPVVNLESFKDILSTVSNLAMKGCLFLGELPVWLAEMDVGDHVGDLSAIKKWLDDLFMSYGFRVKMIEYDEVARNLRQDSAKRVSEVSTSILFVAEHLRFSDDQMETWRTEFQRIEEEGDEEGFEEL